MDLSPLAISASALSAQRARMNVIAENLANADTTRTPEGGPYRRRQVIFEAQDTIFNDLLGAEIGRGVKVAAIVEAPNSVRRVYQPGHPDADQEGYVALPNIKPVIEMIDLMAATRAYEANVTAIQALKSMMHKALELGR
ncbi:MAG: flagellar basal body rod protein FlgC [Candidatus Methylomirabilia bacterium]